MANYILNQVGPDGECCEDCSRASPCDSCGPSCALITPISACKENAQLCGWSGYDDGSYDPDSPDDWAGQRKKWSSRVLSGEITYRNGDCSDCAAPPSPPIGSWAFIKYVFTGAAEITCESGPTDASREYWASGIDPETGLGDCEIQYLFSDETQSLSTPVGPVGDDCSSGNHASDTKTLTERTITGCGCFGGADPYASQRGVAQETLSGEVTLSDALLSQAPLGLSPWAYQSSDEFTLTTPEDTGPITKLGDAQTSISNIGLTGLTPGNAYRLTIRYATYEIIEGTPACSLSGVTLSETPAYTTEEVVFTAEHWAEAFAWECTDTPEHPAPSCGGDEPSCVESVPDVIYPESPFPVHCSVAAWLEARVEEASAWNETHPEEMRYVFANKMSFPVPIPPAGALTRFDRCSLEDLGPAE